MTYAIYHTIYTGTTFNDANLKDTEFTDVYLGPFDQKNLCLNPTLAGTNPVLLYVYCMVHELYHTHMIYIVYTPY